MTLTPTKSVLSFDTDRIKNYVFATGSLATIRGASAVLDKLNRVEMQQEISQVAPESEKVFADGGSGMFRLDSSHVDAAIAAVEYLYRRETDTASITGASIEYADKQELEEQLVLLPYRVRKAKEKAPQFMGMVSSSFMKTCESCGISYANKTFTGAEGTEYVCRACYIKKSEDRLQKKQIHSYFSPDFEPDTGRAQPLWQRLSSKLKERKYGGNPERQYFDRPNDFNELGELSTPSGYIGLIVADGDEMGQLLDRFKSLQEFSDFAKIVDQSLYDALYSAIVEHLQPPAGQNVLPFDVLLLAGDDLVMVTRAQSALQVAVQLVEDFSSISEQYGRRLKLSASVVIAHDRFPFQAAHKTAESGLSFAKQKAHELKMQGKECSTGLINFLVLSSPSSLDFQGIYNTDLKTIAHDGITSNIRTLRPYSPESLHILMEAVQDLSGASRTRLHQLAEACYLDRNNSKLNGFTALSRWQEKSGGQAWAIKKLFDDIRKYYGFTDKFAFPWLVDQENNHHSPLVDLLEIFDFVKGGVV